MKTVRFAKVVERSGRPHAHALWVAPERDAEFKRARQSDRVMTIEPSTRGKADVGVVGFDKAHSRGSQFLIFPKSLKPFDGARVVGVKFDMVDQPSTAPAEPSDFWAVPRAKSRPVGPKLHSPPPEPPEEETPMVVTAARSKTTAPVSKQHAPAKRSPPLRAPPAAARRSRGARKHDTRIPEDALLHEVQAALRELRDGKTVAAYQRLERAAEVAKRA